MGTSFDDILLGLRSADIGIKSAALVSVALIFEERNRFPRIDHDRHSPDVSDSPVRNLLEIVEGILLDPTEAYAIRASAGWALGKLPSLRTARLYVAVIMSENLPVKDELAYQLAIALEEICECVQIDSDLRNDIEGAFLRLEQGSTSRVIEIVRRLRLDLRNC